MTSLQSNIDGFLRTIFVLIKAVVVLHILGVPTATANVNWEHHFMPKDPLYTAYDAFDEREIVVTTSKELSNALEILSASGGGTILVDGDAGPYIISAQGMGGPDSPILIKPLSDDTPPLVHQVDITSSSHITVTGMTINSDAIDETRAHWLYDINVKNSDTIEIVGNTMSSDADGYRTKTNNVEIGEGAASLRDSTNITFSHNTISNYNTGIYYMEVKGLTISHNDISGIQGDGMRGGGIQDVVISHNYLHDFYGSAQDVNHTDMIQIWGTNAEMLTQNVEISHNILDAGNGAATQAIFIKNEEFKNSGYYQDISIHNNVIHNGMAQGIGVSHTKGLEITDNTLLWNTAAQTQSNSNAEFVSNSPRIMLVKTPEAQVNGNVASGFSKDDNNFVGNNYLTDYVDPTAANYVGHHVMNLSGMGDTTLKDLQFLYDSILYGQYGADLSSLTPSDDGVDIVMRQYELVGNRLGVGLSAEYSTIDGKAIDPETTDVRWLFDDGTVIEGLYAEYTFGTPGVHEVKLQITDASGAVTELERLVRVDSTENVKLEFSANGVVDLSHWDAELDIKDPQYDALVEIEGGYGFELDGSTRITMTRANDQMYNLDTFQIDLSFKLDEGGSSGALVHHHGAFNLDVNKDGSLSAKVITGEGKFVITTPAGALKAGEWADITMSYDSLAETLSVYVNGEQLAEGYATGTTPPETYHSVIIGNPWQPSVEGIVSAFSIDVPPSKVYGDYTLPSEEEPPTTTVPDTDPEPAPDEEEAPTEIWYPDWLLEDFFDLEVGGELDVTEEGSADDPFHDVFAALYETLAETGSEPQTTELVIQEYTESDHMLESTATASNDGELVL